MSNTQLFKLYKIIVRCEQRSGPPRPSVHHVTENYKKNNKKTSYKFSYDYIWVYFSQNQQPGAEEAFKILGHAFDLIGEAVSHILNPKGAKRNKNHLLFSSAEMFKKHLWQTVWTQIRLLL